MDLYHHLIHDHRVGGLYSPLFNIKKDAILIKVVQGVGAGQIDIIYKPKHSKNENLYQKNRALRFPLLRAVLLWTGVALALFLF